LQSLGLRVNAGLQGILRGYGLAFCGAGLDFCALRRLAWICLSVP
jgi:hypothetical protein